MKWFLGLIVILLLTASWSTVAFAASTKVSPAQTAQTASYRIKLQFGPVVKPEGMGAMSGMLSMDQGKPVNQHLGIIVQDKRSGAAAMNIFPEVKISDEKSGTSRGLGILRCMPPNDHGAGPHFGNNLYLPDGTYTVTVTVGKETAVFRGVVVKAAGSGM
jgi:hypothetical protein